MKVIYQHDSRDCGAACLSMIATHYGLKYPISKYRDFTKTDKSGTSIYGLVDGAERIGLEANALNGSSEDLLSGICCGDITYPFIAHTVSEDSTLHYVVVYGKTRGKFMVADPARGKIKKTEAEFFDMWTGHIITFQRTEEFVTGNFKKGSILKFFSLIKGQCHKLIGIFVLSLIVSVIGILSAFVFEVVIDEFAIDTGYYETENESEHQHGDEINEEHTHESTVIVGPLAGILGKIAEINFNVIFISLIILNLIHAGIQFARGYLIIAMSKKIDIALSLTYYNHIFDLPSESVSLRQTGEYLSRFSDAATIRTAISGATLTIMLDSIMVIGSGIILCYMNEKMFSVSLLMVVLYALIIFVYKRPVEHSNRLVMENNAILQSYFKESVDGFETVKAACAENEIKESTRKRFTGFINAVVKNSFISMTQDTLADTIEQIGMALILWVGFGLVLVDQVTIGAVITFYVLLTYFTEPIKNLIELQPTIQTAIVAADRLNDILDLQKENEESGELIENIDKIEFQDVNFRYGNHELALRDVNMTIKRGERIAIVGESGSGKTTLAKLLLRFYHPESGTIRIDDKEINVLSLESLRRSIAYVDQNTFLFSDTIRNNLCLGNPEISDEEIEYACSISRADAFIQELPMGYSTPLDENGANLSGGQRQRLALARALLKKPKLLILDEATSNLDTITETAIKDTIFGLEEDLTCIIIAHRLSTIKNCDRIYVMEQGRIIESGSHEALMAGNGKYAELWNAQ